MCHQIVRVAMANTEPMSDYKLINHCFSGKLWYLQHNCVGDTIVYHWNSGITPWLWYLEYLWCTHWRKEWSWYITSISYNQKQFILTSGLFYRHGFTLIPVIAFYHIVWDEITYPFPNLSGCTIEVWKWISNFIPHFIGHAVRYSYWD